MNSPITFTVGELLLSVVWIGLIVLIAYIVAILIRFYRMSKKVEGILDRHKDDVDLIIKELPQITQNVQEISTEAAHMTKAFRGTVDNVAETAEHVTGAVNENSAINETLTSVYKALTTVKVIFDKINSLTSREK